jgi:hypothetical protein
MDSLAWFMRAVGVAVVFLIGFAALRLAYYSLAPMSWWVDYGDLEVVQTPKGEEPLMRLHRTVPASAGTFVVKRLVELQEKTADGVRQYCLTNVDTQASAVTNPVISASLRDYLGEECIKNVLPKLDGHLVHILALYQTSIPPYHVIKSKAFVEGPFVVKDGALRVPDKP